MYFISKFRILLVGLIFSLVLSSYENIHKLSCRNSCDCSTSQFGVIYGGTAPERDRAQRELAQAASIFSAWTGRSAPFGVVSLRNSYAIPFLATLGSRWVLQFDETETKLVEKGLPQAIASGGIVKLPYESKFDTYDDGDLSHEICHKYVEQLALSIDAPKAVPDMVNEAAAISCEPPQARARQLSSYYLGGRQDFSAADLFTARNPLSINQDILQGAGLPVRNNESHTVSFLIEPASGLSRDVAAYYYKSAALQEYLRHAGSPGLAAIGRLIIASANGVTLHDWLSSEHSNGLTENEAGFSRAVNAVAASSLAGNVSPRL